MPDRDTIRCSFDLPRDLHDKLKSYLPYGTKRYFFQRIIELALEGMDQGGYEVTGAILKGDFNPLANAVLKRERSK